MKIFVLNHSFPDSKVLKYSFYRNLFCLAISPILDLINYIWDPENRYQAVFEANRTKLKTRNILLLLAMMVFISCKTRKGLDPLDYIVVYDNLYDCIKRSITLVIMQGQVLNLSETDNFRSYPYNVGQ